MSTFRTVLTPERSLLAITHQDAILSIGSCFAVHIANRLQQYKFQVQLNPFGILFNPVSIGQGIECLVSDKIYQEEDLIFHNEQWHSFDHHSSLSGATAELALSKINTNLKATRNLLPSTKFLLLTLGTSIVYEHKESLKVVANCHKIPNHQFTKFRLTVKETFDALVGPLTRLKKTYSDLQVILTVSPVRHIKDGVVENQRSKSTLLLAADELCEHHPFVHYFPSYEILMDDLRDYRFYEDDMIHPNKSAIDYTWNFFQNTFFKEATQSLIRQIDPILKASRHRPFNPASKAHEAFINVTLEKIDLLENTHPFLEFGKERKLLKADDPNANE